MIEHDLIRSRDDAELDQRKGDNPHPNERVHDIIEPN
jgi:hypothetical protein